MSVRTIVAHRDIGDNLLENGLSFYKLLVLAAVCLLELCLELLDFPSCEKFCIVSRGSHYCGHALSWLRTDPGLLPPQGTLVASATLAVFLSFSATVATTTIPRP